MTSVITEPIESESTPFEELPRLVQAWQFTRRHPTLILGIAMVGVFIAVAAAAPWISDKDPIGLDVFNRLKPPSGEFWFGADMYGRDVFTRVIYGTRVSLLVGAVVAAFGVSIGLLVGLSSGYVRSVDAWLMRIMDGLMAIPGLLLAIGLISVLPASVENVIIALTVPQVPRVARLVRGIVLVAREITYVESAIASGAGTARVVFKHIMPNTIAPLIVQATFICADAMLAEAALSFLGAGTPSEVPSWGNIMAEGRAYLASANWIILFPGLSLATMVLAINLVGDGLRDLLDPRFAREI